MGEVERLKQTLFLLTINNKPFTEKHIIRKGLLYRKCNFVGVGSLDYFIYTLKNMEILDRMPFMAKNAVFRK